MPGSEFNYNNTGYALITEVINRVTETPFPEWMKQNVFGPLEMHHTVVRTSPNQIVKNRSAGYVSGSDGGFREVTDLGGAAGPGGIHSTMGDLAKWIKNLNNPIVGTASMIEEMTKPFELNDGSFTEYGLGLVIQEYKGLPCYRHGGADMAHRSMLMVFPGINAAVVTQSNNATADSLTLHFDGNHIARKIEFALEPDKMAEYTGRYYSEEIETLYTVLMKDGSLYLRNYQMDDDLMLSAASRDRFGSEFPLTSVHFVRNENGEITGFKASSGRTRDVLFEKWD